MHELLELIGIGLLFGIPIVCLGFFEYSTQGKPIISITINKNRR